MKNDRALTDAEIEDTLARINARLNAARLGVRVQLRGKSLSLVATLPARPSSTKNKRHQQRIALKLLANPKGLKQAEVEAKLLGARLASKEFDWALYLDNEEQQFTAEFTCSQWIERFKAHIIATNFADCDSETADLLWRRRFFNLGLNKLAANSEITPESLTMAAQQSRPNTRSRQICCQNLERLAKFTGVEVNLTPYKGNYSPQKVSPRSIPSREAIESAINKMKTLAWRWVYGMMAAYGLRDHEVFFCEVEWREEKGKARVLIAKVNEGKTGPREVLPLYPDWVDLWHLWDVEIPSVTARIHEEYGERVSRSFKRAGIEFGPYDLRHAYAIRASVEFGLPVAVAAALCGHSQSVHLSKYNRWINQHQHSRAWNEAVNRHQKGYIT